MKNSKIENDENSNIKEDQSHDLFSLVFHKTMFMNEQARDRDREAIRSWLNTPDTSD